MSKDANFAMSYFERMLREAARMGAELALHEGRALLRTEQQSIAHRLAQTRSPVDDGVLLKESEVAKRLSVSSKTLHRWVKAGKFPQPVTISARGKRWKSSEVTIWVERQGEVAREATGTPNR